MVFNEELLNFIFADQDEYLKFSHRTESEEVAQSIMEQGFRYMESLQKTTDPIVNDQVYLSYWHNLRIYYGSFTVVICIAKSIFIKYLNELESRQLNNVLVEEVLSEPVADEDGDQDQITYLLPKQYIRGYFNSDSGKVVYNPEFDPEYDSPEFMKRVEKF